MVDFSALPEPPVLRFGRYRERDTGHTIARGVLGLTAYLADPLHWAQGPARAVWNSFCEQLPREHLTRFSSSTSTTWRNIGVGDLEAIGEAFDMRRHYGLRHFFRARIQNDYGAPSLGFSYTEIDPTRATRSGVLEITIPEEWDPGVLFQLAMEILSQGPVDALVGGHVMRFSDMRRAGAFWQFYRWSARFIGLDVQVPEETAWKTPSYVPAPSWLTFVGARPLAFHERTAAEFQQRSWQEQVAAMPIGDGVLLRAGELPSTGDLNRMDFPAAYAEVARALEPCQIPEPQKFWGPFDRNGDTLLWSRRFVDLESWMDRRLVIRDEDLKGE